MVRQDMGGWMVRNNRWSVFVVCLLLAGLLPFSTTGSIAGAGTHKVLVDNADGATQATLAQSGARLLVDYGSFGLWEVPDSRIQTLAGRASVQQRDDFDDIYVRTGKITTPSGVPTAPSNLRQSKVSGKQLWMVQFVGPIKPDWLDNLRALGARSSSTCRTMPTSSGWTARGSSSGGIRREGPDGRSGQAHTNLRTASNRRCSALRRAITPVTIQFYRTPNTAASLAASGVGGAVSTHPRSPDFTNITLEVPASHW